MALSEKEKELYRILYSEKLNTIQEKSLAEREKINWMPNSSETDRLKLDIERRRRFLKEILDAHVNSLIETLKKVGKNVDENDFNELYETLKIVVNSNLEDFYNHCKNHYKNNILSNLPSSIIESNIHILKNELPSLIPKALLPLSKFKIETELLNNTSPIGDYEKALKLIRNSMLAQSRNPIQLAKYDEDSYRKIISNSLNTVYEGKVFLEALNKDGKTDILLRINNRNVLIVECKIWSTRKDFQDAINQLIGRYLEWHDNKAILIIFCRNNNHTKVRSIIKEEIKKHINYVDTLEPDCENEFRFWFRHPEDKNRQLLLTVLSFKIPKNQTSKRI